MIAYFHTPTRPLSLSSDVRIRCYDFLDGFCTTVSAETRAQKRRVFTLRPSRGGDPARPLLYGDSINLVADRKMIEYAL